MLETPPPKPKKITGTRFPSILGYNKWNTPFQTWCELTKAASVPFEDTIYTIAGKTIEPMQIEYMKDYLEDPVVDPRQYYGESWNNTYEYYGFYDDPVFNGKWDAAVLREDGKTIKAIVECKTTSRKRDWEDGVPIYYAMQTALYAALSGCEWFYIVASFLNPGDYDDPSTFKVTDENSEVYAFRVSDFLVDGMTVEELMGVARKFYDDWVLTGVSPSFDEKRDKDYLDILRTVRPDNDKAIEEIIAEWVSVDSKISEIKESMSDLEKRKKGLTSAIKSASIGMFNGATSKVQYDGVMVSQRIDRKINEERLLSIITPEQLESCYDTSEVVTVRKSKKGDD